MILFAYNFPHKKTQDFLFFSQYYNIKIDIVLGAPRALIEKPELKYNTNVNYIGLIDTLEMCWKMKIPYYMVNHNSDECLQMLKQRKPEVGIISGARILSPEVINSFSKGIINFHPGGIPECRGLDTAQWIVYNNLSIAVTSHFIDGRVDAGWIIKRQEFDRFKGDTLQDIGLRLYHGQLAIFRETLALVASRKKEDFEYVPLDAPKPYGYFPPELEDEMYEKCRTL